mmetsp:Transcript_35000/g.60257  ORF Transcript_35000/g.60257 Transcript_35000/m.60257 type:complete len:266 (-) Transcript_35000:164-961(-)
MVMPPAAAPGCSDWGFRTVSSMLRMTHAASAAAEYELILFTAGSHTPDSIVLQMPSLFMSTPDQRPTSAASACDWRSSFSTVVASKPAFSQSWRGTTSRALAKADTMSCCLPMMVRAYSRRNLETSISIAPPPATTLALMRPRFTIMSASWIERCDSSMNCSLPPRSTMVAVLAFVHLVNTLYRSSPTCRSSNSPHSPRTSGVRSFTVDCMWPPVACATRLRSAASTRPAQKRPRSAKYCVARSPIGSFDRMIWAPDSTHLSSFS